ncbi:MAG: hypothetical protein R2680_10645 [Nitrososphaeraceae archaeon]
MKIRRTQSGGIHNVSVMGFRIPKILYIRCRGWDSNPFLVFTGL